MMSWHISLGYNSAAPVSEDEAWVILKKKTREVCDNPQAIIEEARRLGAPESCPDGCCDLAKYADIYAKPFTAPGHPIEIVGMPDDREVVQFASTGENIKYHVRRAFVRLLIEAMHREGIEVSLVVA